MAESRVVKVYLMSAHGCSDEIRRFTLSTEGSSQKPNTTYIFFLSKITALFPVLNGKSFKITWKDEEGDDIVMSSDEELWHALCSTGGGPLKVFVNCAQTPCRGCPGCTSDRPLHPNVVCDGCDGQIMGYRYKCLECEDYDLCETCLPRIRHPAHNLVRIVHPDRRTWPFLPFFGKKAWKNYTSWAPYSAEGKVHHRRRKHASDKRNAKDGECHLLSDPHWMNILQLAGKSMADILDPFGIGVTVEVERGEQEPQESGPKQSVSATGGDLLMDTQAGPSQPAAKTQSAHIGEKGSDDGEDSDWAMVTEGSPSRPQVENGSNLSGAVHTDSKIAEVVAQMAGMGFCDEGGWLTKLVEAKGGDIGAVLDSLHPDSR